MAEFGKWTSVEEELPKEDEYYLIYGMCRCVPDHIDDHDTYNDMLISYYSTHYGWIGTNCEDVKYWMELPAPPVEGGDDK